MFSVSIYTYNSPFPACDAGETNASDVGAIHAWVVYSRPGGNYGVTNLVPITHPYLVPGESYWYSDAATYVVQAQDIITNGSYKGYIGIAAYERGDIHANFTSSAGNSQITYLLVYQPGIQILAQCQAGTGEKGVVTYFGTITNCGNVPLTNVAVTGVTNGVPYTIPCTSVLGVGQVASFSGGWIPSQPCLPSTNILTVVGTDQGASPQSVANTTTIVCQNILMPGIAVTLSCPPAQALSGGPITYSGTVNNSGNVTLTNVVVTDSQPVPSTVLTLASLAPGSTSPFTASFTAPLDACSVSSTATATGSDYCSGIGVTNNATATCSLRTLVLHWTNAVLQSAHVITGTFTNVPGATSPYTNPITGDQQYFRLISN